ncbi:MAG: hypothetical protein WB341_10995 [Terracidiphilus sp.]
MVKGRKVSGKFASAALGLAVTGAQIFGPCTAPAQSGAGSASPASPAVEERFLINRFPDKPSLPPSWTIPVDPLGFSAPGAIYLGARNVLASLDFLDENRLLFTFRVPGLLRRDLANSEGSDERQIRALVLTLPQGAVEAEALWTVHDRVRYLWPLRNGHFLLRDQNNLFEGDATLKLKPYLEFPGSLLWVEMDPAQHFLVTNSREPAPPPAKPGQVSSPSTASATVTTDQDSAAGTDHPDLVVRILRRESGQVMLVSRVRSAVHLPINSTGYLENLRGQGSQWVLNLNYFTGGATMVGRVESACEPDDDFVSEQEIFVTACGPSGESKLVAMTTSGRTLWVSQGPSTEVWPQLTVAANGSRLAWETLDTTHAIESFAPMEAEDVKEQSVTVFDAANGDIALVSPVSPVLDVGGNVAISPSGRRVALLNAGAIEVFELSPPPALPGAAAAHP